jgi:hypothetical protein
MPSVVRLSAEFFQEVTKHPVPLDLGALRALRGSALVVGKLVDTLRTPPTLAETAHDDGGINVARRVIRPQVIGKPCGLELTRPKDLQRWAGLSGDGSFATRQWMDLSRSLPSCHGVPRAIIGARRSRSQKTQIARITMTTRTAAAIAIVRVFMCPPRDWF